MTDVKMPEPVYFTTKNGRLWTFPDEVDQTGLELRIYTEAQLMHYGDDRAREALEMAADVVMMYTPRTGHKSPNWIRSLAMLDAIRLLAKEIK